MEKPTAMKSKAEKWARVREWDFFSLISSKRFSKNNMMAKVNETSFIRRTWEYELFLTESFFFLLLCYACHSSNSSSTQGHSHRKAPPPAADANERKTKTRERNQREQWKKKFKIERKKHGGKPSTGEKKAKMMKKQQHFSKWKKNSKMKCSRKVAERSENCTKMASWRLKWSPWKPP